MKLKVGLTLLLAFVGVLLSLPALKLLLPNGRSLAILPVPKKIERQRGSFSLASNTAVVADENARPTAEYLAQRLRLATGYKIPITPQTDSTAPIPRLVMAMTSGRWDLGSEGYQLLVSPTSASIQAPTSVGLFYGVQSLLQLFPPDIFAHQAQSSRKWEIPCVTIGDRPRFPWRGLMLDVSRHFFNKEELKQLLDAMALHKLNTFHWHLTDDQGWRLEIKKYPRLTEVGAWRHKIGFGLDPRSTAAYGPDGRYGGYYTQADVQEVVAYAQSRHITIVPEIEMPGHASAALAAYPEFSCFGGPYFTDMSSNTSAGVFCAGNEATYAFLEDVLGEVIHLFPGIFIHIGGDEVPKQNWKDCPRCQGRIRSEGLKDEHGLQGYFIGRIEKFIRSRDRRLIGWSEIREGGLPSQAAIMDWIGGGVEAASTGHDVVMSPDGYCYFDFYQSRDHASEPPAIGGYLPLQKVYSFDPLPSNLAPQFQPHILGAQANVWTEFMPSLSHVEYMTFPRLCALAEAVWSPQNSRNWDDFTRRLPSHLQRLDRLGINYRRLDKPQ
jgi:hexosaminidase